MKAILLNEMTRLEKVSIEEYGIPSIVLMENAATGFASALIKELGDISDKKVLVVCGRGNNAGDGFAIARLLHFRNISVSILSMCDVSLLKGDAKTNATALKNMKIPFISEYNQEYDIIIDAIFGTGFHGTVDIKTKEIIEKINNSSAFIASVDVPSGVSLNNPCENETFIKSDLCITFGYAKFNQFMGSNQESFKKIIVAPISIPEPLKFYQLITKDSFSLLPNRPKNSHKGTFGKVLAFVGSHGMAGAAILSGSAILKSGAGMATVATSDMIIPIIAHEFPSVMTCPLPTECGHLTGDCTKLLIEKAKNVDAVLIGCGLGRDETTEKIVLDFIKKCELPMIIDADGLNILSENIDVIKNKKVILTPHIVEFSRLSGVSPDQIKKNPKDFLQEFCKKTGATVVLKDSATLICHKGEDFALCHAPNSGMATAGSGDVLAGIITSFTAQGLSPFDAACAGVYIHSAAGAIAKNTLGEAGMTSVDILNFVPQAFLEKYDITPHIKEL